MLSQFNLHMEYNERAINTVADAMSSWVYPAGSNREDGSIHGSGIADEEVRKMLLQEKEDILSSQLQTPFIHYGSNCVSPDRACLDQHAYSQRQGSTPVRLICLPGVSPSSIASSQPDHSLQKTQVGRPTSQITICPSQRFLPQHCSCRAA